MKRYKILFTIFIVFCFLFIILYLGKIELTYNCVPDRLDTKIVKCHVDNLKIFNNDLVRFTRYVNPTNFIEGGTVNNYYKLEIIGHTILDIGPFKKKLPGMDIKPI
jgi:hypothetical protein